MHISSPAAGKLRSLNTRKDLLPVADLIELCFGRQMDADGWKYVHTIRQAAADRNQIRWMLGAGERIAYPLHGYVWEEDNQIIGNLSIIPFYKKGVWRYLIANVAVHPEYRRRGIARQLTLKALEHIQSLEVASAWLQVRADNAAAIHLYQELGFLERAVRTTWQRDSLLTPEAPAYPGYKFTSRAPQDWELQRRWLNETYPPDVIWNLPLEPERFAPSLWQKFVRLLNAEDYRHWAVRGGGKLLGIATWQASTLHADYLWLATDPHEEQEAIAALLPYIRGHLHNYRPLSINYPAYRAAKSFQQGGFRELNTLIWMEHPLASSSPFATLS